MADTQQPIIVQTGDEAARRQLAAEMAEMAKHPLDETVPGGVYQNAAGTGYHNAHGQPVSESGAVLSAEQARAQADEAARQAADEGAEDADGAAPRASARKTRRK